MLLLSSHVGGEQMSDSDDTEAFSRTSKGRGAIFRNYSECSVISHVGKCAGMLCYVKRQLRDQECREWHQYV